jgi:hypothetical protein
MEPTLSDGDLLLVRWGAAPVAGRLALVDLPGGRPLSVKRLGSRTPDGWWVERDNPLEGVDSWAVGPVPASGVRALVVARLPRLPRRGAGRLTCRRAGWSRRGGPRR